MFWTAVRNGSRLRAVCRQTKPTASRRWRSRCRAGSGMTALLNPVGGLDIPTAGDVRLAEHAGRRPGELSGGTQHRLAVARTLANEPDLIIADEPTGQRDSESGRSIMRLLRAVVRGEGVTALVATRDPALIELADRVVELRDGRIVDEHRPADR
nr:ATP-binding cassette domain-containing protein [Streptomyces subrutilus]